jgi:hypothetical protein
MTAGVTLLAVLLCSVPQAVTLDRVMAVVNGDVVTMSDLRLVRTLRLPVGGAERPASDDALLRLLVDRYLVVEELRRFQVPSPGDAALAPLVREWREAFVETDPDELMSREGVTPAFVERWLADELRRETYLAQRFAALPTERRADAIRSWIDGLRQRATITYRIQRF